MSDWTEFAVGLIPRSLLLAAGILATLFAIREVPPRIRHALAIAGLAALAMLPLLVCFFPRWEWVLLSEAVPTASGFSQSGSLFGWLVCLWLGGFLWSLASLGFSARKVKSLAEKAAPPPPEDRVHAILSHLAEHFGIDFQVRLGISDELASPVVCGLIRPSILLPREALSWPESRLTRVLAHECAHLARRDLRTQWIALVIRAAYWFNPLVARLVRVLTQAREMAADEMALIATDRDRAGYARELLTIAAETRGRFHHAAAAAWIGAASSKLEDRIRRIVSDPSDNSRISIWRWAGAGVLAVCVFIVALCAGPAANLSDDPWSDAEVSLRLSADPFPVK